MHLAASLHRIGPARSEKHDFLFIKKVKARELNGSDVRVQIYNGFLTVPPLFIFVIVPQANIVIRTTICKKILALVLVKRAACYILVSKIKMTFASAPSEISFNGELAKVDNNNTYFLISRDVSQICNFFRSFQNSSSFSNFLSYLLHIMYLLQATLRLVSDLRMIKRVPPLNFQLFCF